MRGRSSHIAIRFKRDVNARDASRFLAAHRAHIRRQLSFAPGLFLIKTPSHTDPVHAAETFSRDSRVMYAEPEVLEQISGRSVGAADHRSRPRQWHLRNEGLDGGTAGADIKAYEAWPMTQGENIVVAVIDLGFYLSLPPLRSAVTSSAAWFRQTLDGDATLVVGRRGAPRDHHGTFCASLAIARASGTNACSGVAPRARLLPVSCLPDAATSQLTLARAIAYAATPQVQRNRVSPGADVISCSLGPSDGTWAMSNVLRDALVYAAEHGRNGLGTPVFWAVADRNTPIALDEVCDSQLTIAVAASDSNDQRGRCAFGSQLSFLAPGVGVYGLLPDGSIAVESGASGAAPIAAGVAALMLSCNPRLSAAEVRAILEQTCDRVPCGEYGTYDAHGHNNYYGYGRVNAARAVEEAAAIPLSAPRGSH